VSQNKPDYSTFQPSLRKFALNPFNTCSTWTNRKTEKKCAFKYYVIINIRCDVIAVVVDVKMKTRLLTSDNRALIH